MAKERRGEESWTKIVKMLPTQKKEQLLANIEVVGEERRRVVEVVGLVQTNQLLPAKKQQHWYTSHPSLAAHKYGDISSS